METKEIIAAFSALANEEKHELLKSLQALSPIEIDQDKCLPLVYKKADGTDEVLYEIIPGREHEINGIKSAGLCFSLKNEEKKYSHKDALDIVHTKGLDLHDPSNHWDIFEEKEKFNATVAILKKNSIPADEWLEDDWYWTKRSVLWSPGSAYLSFMKFGLLSSDDKGFSSCVRGCRALNF